MHSSEAMADQDAIASGIYGMGSLAAAQGQARQAARLLGIAEQLATSGGFQFEIPGPTWFEHIILIAKERLGEEIWLQEYQAGQAFATDSVVTMEQAIAYALEYRDE